MSTVEGFVLHLYCDDPSECGAFDEFSGENRAEARRDARQKGWAISTKDAPESSTGGGKFALCPKHAKKGSATPKSTLRRRRSEGGE
jgi:hypothetical protein